MPIKNWNEFYELETMVREADERLKLGTGASGLHFQLKDLLRRLSAYGHTREQTISVGKRRLREWENTQGSPPSRQQHEQDFVERYGDQD